MLCRPGTTVGEAAARFREASFGGGRLAYAEAEDGRRVAADETLAAGAGTVLRFVAGAAPRAAARGSAGGADAKG
jgi:hypothetical protein